MTETELQDSILRHALELQRLSQGEEAKADAILRELESELRALLNSRTLSAASRREINALLKEAEKAVASRYINIAGIVDTEAIAQHVAERTASVIGDAFPGASIGMPTLETLRSVAKDILIDGAPSSAWWAKQAQDTAFKFAGVVRRGILNGATNEQIVREVVGEAGVMGLSRRNARVLVHSSIMTAANRARLETYRKNANYAAGVRWVSTLDSHVCWTAETPIMMADGSWKKAGEVRVGDWVTGGVSGEPCRVILADKRVAQSSVVIHLDGEHVGSVTHEHPILTPNGWQEAGRIALSSDIHEREVLCRDFTPPERALPRAPKEGGDWLAPCDISGMAETRCSTNEDHREGYELRDGIRDGDRLNQPVGNASPEWLQHDERGGWPCRCGARGGVARQDCREEQGASQGPGVFGIEPDKHEGSLARPGATLKDECCEGCQTGGIEGRPGVGSSPPGEGCGGYAGKMARPGISGQDEATQAAGDTDRSSTCCISKTVGHDGRGQAFRDCQEVLGNPEGVKTGWVTGRHTEGDVEVITLSIEGDETYVAGGVITHNCKRCAALDGTEWDFDGNALNGRKFDFQAPPAHFACRCVVSIIPGTDALEEAFPGITAKFKAGRQRASKDGPTDANDFASFLKRQPPAFVEDVLGKRRAELYLAGKLSLSDLITKGGREKTLAEL